MVVSSIVNWGFMGSLFLNLVRVRGVLDERVVWVVNEVRKKVVVRGLNVCL